MDNEIKSLNILYINKKKGYNIINTFKNVHSIYTLHITHYLHVYI